MKFFIVTRGKAITILSCVIIAVFTLAISVNTATVAVQTMAEKRKIPIYCVEKGDDEKVVSISFDAAWGNEQTNELIDILDKYNVKTTFFVVGDWVDKYPESVKAIYDAGHEVCNHSDSHPHLTEKSQEQIRQEISKCNDKIEKITGVKPILFRPPYGDYDNKVVSTAEELGMYCIQWDVDSLDWKDPTPDQMKERVLSKVKNGSIVLFHNGAANTPKTLPMVLEGLLSQGYSIVPISELIHKDTYTTDNNGMQLKPGIE
ncbi:MAG: polysaccharide deacetylase family protein [Clostridia bacterium]|nr:polysaccharide deacetylase family protein [Clostridia bacterium]